MLERPCGHAVIQGTDETDIYDEILSFWAVVARAVVQHIQGRVSFEQVHLLYIPLNMQ